MRRHVIDKPRALNLANYEQRLRKMVTLFKLMTAELEQALERIEKEKHA